MTDRVRIAAHAKANLFLRVLAREDTGYHALETLFALLELHDHLEVERADRGVTLEISGPDLGPVEENLAYRAADLLLHATGQAFGVRITLEKRIPPRAGLGGGSSDAAATLHAVNLLADRAVPRHEVLQVAARLGSDVPFFASGTPCALAWGRGERLFRLPSPPAAPVLLIVPPFGVGSAEAYTELDAARAQEVRRGAVVFDVEAFSTWSGIARLGGNDFESLVFGRWPAHRATFERLANTGPLAVRLSGSGSALIAVYRSEGQRDQAALELAGGDYQIIKTATRDQPAPPPIPA